MSESVLTASAARSNRERSIRGLHGMTMSPSFFLNILLIVSSPVFTLNLALQRILASSSCIFLSSTTMSLVKRLLLYLSLSGDNFLPKDCILKCVELLPPDALCATVLRSQDNFSAKESERWRPSIPPIMVKDSRFTISATEGEDPNYTGMVVDIPDIQTAVRSAAYHPTTKNVETKQDSEQTDQPASGSISTPSTQEMNRVDKTKLTEPVTNSSLNLSSSSSVQQENKVSGANTMSMPTIPSVQSTKADSNFVSVHTISSHQASISQTTSGPVLLNETVKKQESFKDENDSMNEDDDDEPIPQIVMSDGSDDS